MTHGGYFTLLCIDFTYNAVVFRKRNMMWAVIALVLYGMWNLFILLFTGNPVYKVLDWVSIQSYVFGVVAVIAMLI
jgi:hypothetical protein